MQGYNGQIMVDTESQVIVSQNATNSTSDAQDLVPLLEGCKENTGRHPGETLADTGYFSEADLNEAGKDTELFITTQNRWKLRKELAEKGPPRGRIPKPYGPREQMARKLRTKRGADAFMQRNQVEAVLGQMCMRSLNSFRLRSQEGPAG